MAFMYPSHLIWSNHRVYRYMRVLHVSVTTVLGRASSAGTANFVVYWGSGEVDADHDWKSVNCHVTFPGIGAMC